MNKIASFIVLLFALGLLIPAHATPTDAPDLIVPGKSLGDIKLGETDAQLREALGKPSKEEAWMGKEICSWIDTKAGTRLDVRLHRSEGDNELTVTDIRTNSPFFHTADGLRVGSADAEFTRLYQDGIDLNFGHLAANQASDYVSHGIAFERSAFEKGVKPKVAAIIVHAPGQHVQLLSNTLP